MIISLAQAAPVQPVSHEFLGMLVAGLLSLLSLAGVVRLWLKPRTEVSPNPLPVELVEQLASKGDLARVETDLARRILAIENGLTEERSTARTDISAVHRRIDVMAENLAEMRGELRTITSNLGRLLDLTMAKAQPPSRRATS